MKIWYVHGQYKASGLVTNRISYNIFDLSQVMKVAAHLQKDLFSLIADNFWLFFLNKWDFGIIPLIFTTLRKKNRSRHHFPLLSKLINLFLKNMSKIRANAYFRFELIFYSQVQKNNFWNFCYDFLSWKMPKEWFFSINEFNLSILILFQICSNNSIILLFSVLKLAITIFFEINP